MANFYFDVDTSPMAKSVDSARGHLNGVTVAVTSMEAAVIAAERESSKNICEKVDMGFHMLVRSQISQKAVAAYTEMSSRQITLLQLAKALDNVKRQMEGDYNMITRRYAKLFQSLNKALETRVKELDRPAMEFAEIRKTVVFDKLSDDSSMLLSFSGEALPVIHYSLLGKIKQKTKDTLWILSESVDEDVSYSEKVDSILFKNTGGTSENTDNEHYIPAVIFITDSLLNSDDSIEYIYTADVWENTAPVVSQVSGVLDTLNWSSLAGTEKDLFRKEFTALCEKESDDERITKEMIRLFDESVWEDCTK
jgi:hypothetical protein